MFYPFLMMDIPVTNSLPGLDGAAKQPAYPWRGYINSAHANPSSAQVTKAMNRFFYGPGESAAKPEWGLAHMITHYAQLCAKAGGVDAFANGIQEYEPFDR